MKHALAFDPRDYDYGAPTAAVRAILRDWEAIDWFEPSVSSNGYLERLFRTFQQLAHPHMPGAFPLDLAIQCVAGDRAAFARWCDRVRTQTDWDWKISILKHLSCDHADAHDWVLDDHACDLASDPPRPGDLFVRVGSSVFWTTHVPALQLGRDRFGEAAQFYLGYAHGDVLDAIKWQLAEDDDDTTANPFVPLLHLYAAGAYPFSLGADEVVLFRFV